MKPSETTIWPTALALTIAAALAVHAAADTDPAEAANRALVAAFEAAWNTHDMPAFGRLLTDDVDWVSVDATQGRGRDRVQAGHETVHAGKFKDSVLTVKQIEVAVLKPDVALLHITWTLRGDRNDDGSPRQPREGLLTWVTVKDGSSWKIRASHNGNRR